jgi:hypothetical protein
MQSEKQRREAVSAVGAVTEGLANAVNDGVARIFVAQRKIDAESRALQANAAKFAKQTAAWIKLVDQFNTALKEVGDIQTWAKTIEADLQVVCATLESIQRENRFETPVDGGGVRRRTGSSGQCQCRSTTSQRLTKPDSITSLFIVVSLLLLALRNEFCIERIVHVCLQPQQRRAQVDRDLSARPRRPRRLVGRGAARHAARVARHEIHLPHCARLAGHHQRRPPDDVVARHSQLERHRRRRPRAIRRRRGQCRHCAANC